jgi:hypothetical protein
MSCVDMITRFEIRWRDYWKILFFQTWRGYHQIKWVFVRSWRYYGTSTVRYYWNPCIHIHVHTLIYLRFWYVKCWYFLEWEISKDIIWRLFHPLFYWSACTKPGEWAWIAPSPSYNAPLSAMKKWPYKRGVLTWRRQFSSILLSLCIGNLAW